MQPKCGAGREGEHNFLNQETKFSTKNMENLPECIIFGHSKEGEVWMPVMIWLPRHTLSKHLAYSIGQDFCLAQVAVGGRDLLMRGMSGLWMMDG